MRISDETLRGRTVVASEGLAIGTVTLLFIDVDGWRVESLQVKLHKDIADRIGKANALPAGRCPSSLLVHGLGALHRVLKGIEQATRGGSVEKV